MKNKEIKQKVENLTLKYIDVFKEEYDTVVKYLEQEREKNKDKFASISGDRVMQRKNYEIPETLYKMWTTELSVDELVKIKDGEDGKEFAHWFAKRFPEFAGGTHI